MHDSVHKAFWDTLQDDLNKIPPDYKHTFVLLNEIKEVLDFRLSINDIFHTNDFYPNKSMKLLFFSIWKFDIVIIDLILQYKI